MARLTKEEQAERIRGYNAGRDQALRGSPWRLSPELQLRSDVYKNAHRKAYLTVVALGKFPVKPIPELKPVVDSTKKEVAEAQKNGYEAGFRQAMEIIKFAQAKTLRGQGEWSSQKISGYQWGYKQSIAGHKPNASGDLRADPQFDEGYKMGYRAGSRSIEKLQTA